MLNTKMFNPVLKGRMGPAGARSVRPMSLRPVAVFPSHAVPTQPPTPGEADELKASFKERMRPARRDVFTYEHWLAHRSDNRHLDWIRQIPESEVLRGLLKPLFLVMCSAVLWGAYFTAFKAGLLWSWLPNIKIGMEAFSLSIPVLSLLLVFRTNSAYQRWDEARKLWGLCVNRSRDLARSGVSYIDSPILRAAWIRWIKAFVWSFKGHVRPGDASDLRARLGAVLTEKEMDDLENSKHRPLYATMMLSRILRHAKLPPPIQQSIDANLTQYHDICGGSERILRTPIFLPYTRNTTRFLLVFLMSLPLAFFHSMGWYSVPALAAVSVLFLGVEEIGVQVEEPFSVLPLEGISETICTNVQEAYDRFPDPEAMRYDWEVEGRSQAAANRGEGRLANGLEPGRVWAAPAINGSN